MIAKLPRKLLIGILSAVVLTVLAISAIPVMAADSSTTTTTATTPTTTTSTTTTTTTTTAKTTPTTTTASTSTTPTTTTTPKSITTTTAVAPPIKIKPTIASVNPGSANQGQTVTGIIITGTGFTGAKGVSFGGGIDVTSFSVDSDTQITANIVIANRAFVGTRFVGVGTPAGRGTLAAGFSVTSDAPTVTGVNPNAGNQGATLTGVTLTGTNFTNTTKVSFGGGINVTGFTVVSDTEITADITIANRAFVGTRFVTVVNESDHGTLSAGFSVTKDAPTVTTVNPSTGVQGATLTGIVVTGTNFTGATAVSFGGGIDVTGFTVNGDTQITASIVIANGAAVGSRFVTVVNQSGRGSDPTGFNVTKNESIVTQSSTTTTTPPKSTTTTATTTTTTKPTTTTTTTSTTTPTTTTPTTTTSTTPTTTTTSTSTTTTTPTTTTTTSTTPTTTTSTSTTTTTPTTTTTH
jgi:Quinohemoprotein amine dehydrogenase, alpha subunit domain III